MYSYGNRRIVIGSPFASTWAFLFILFAHVVSDIVRSITRTIPLTFQYVDVFLIIIAIIFIAFRCFQSSRAKHRPDLPSAIDITSTGTLRLFHGQEIYAELQLSQFTSLKEVPLDVPPWRTVNASQLMLDSKVGGVDYIYVLPYLKGYSEVMSKLYDLSPALRHAHEGDVWENGTGGGSFGSALWLLYKLALWMLAFFALIVLVVFIAAAVQSHTSGHHHYHTQKAFIGIESVLIVMLIFGVRAARRSVTQISFYPDKMQIARSSIWYTDFRPEEITKVEVISSGKKPEQCIIHTTSGDYSISSGDMKDYTGLVRRIRHFIGEPQVSPTQ